MSVSLQIVGTVIPVGVIGIYCLPFHENGPEIRKMVKRDGKMNKSNTENEMIYFGPGLKNEEIDEKFSKLYVKLLDYVRNIFELVEEFCPGCDDQVRLALNIAEMDGNLLQRLVAKECEKRRELMRINEISISQKSMNKNLMVHNVSHFIDSRLLTIEKKDNQALTQ